MRVTKRESQRNNLSNDAASARAAVGVNGSGGLGGRLGLREDGVDGEE